MSGQVMLFNSTFGSSILYITFKTDDVLINNTSFVCFFLKQRFLQPLKLDNLFGRISEKSSTSDFVKRFSFNCAAAAHKTHKHILSSFSTISPHPRPPLTTITFLLNLPFFCHQHKLNFNLKGTAEFQRQDVKEVKHRASQTS